MKKRAILSAGGTGGHLFPAQSLAEALNDWEILFVAGALSTNRYFNRDQFAFQDVKSATFSFRNPIQVVSGAGKICSGVLKSRSILRQFNPDVVIGFGSFFTLPVLLAAAIEKKPIVLHEQNAVPGKVNRLFAPFAHTTTITFPDTRQFLKGKAKEKAVEVLFPTRKRQSATAQEAWNYFGLEPSQTKPLILVYGGSQGAAKMNALFLESLSYLGEVQVLHFTGTEERAQEARSVYEKLKLTACIKAFEPRIDLALQIADIAVTRAGAATVCELIDAALPSLLIPFPFATENHQDINAAHFVEHVRGGKVYQENKLTAILLANYIRELLEHKELYRSQIKTYQEKRLTTHLADLIRNVFI